MEKRIWIDVSDREYVNTLQYLIRTYEIPQI